MLIHVNSNLSCKQSNFKDIRKSFEIWTTYWGTLWAMNEIFQSYVKTLKKHSKKVFLNHPFVYLLEQEIEASASPVFIAVGSSLTKFLPYVV